MELVVVDPIDDSENGVGGGAGIIEGFASLFGANNPLLAKDSLSTEQHEYKVVQGKDTGPVCC